MANSKVLVLLGNVPLYGLERSNITVFEILKKKGIEPLFVTDQQWGSHAINPFLDQSKLNYVAATYMGLLGKQSTFSDWLINIGAIVKGSFRLLRIIRDFKPDYIHVPSERNFISMMPALLASKVKVVYRCGDEPRLHNRVFRFLWLYVIGKRVSQFVAISNHIKGHLLKAGVHASKVNVIYNYPPVRHAGLMNKDTIQIRKDNSKWIVYLGQITAAKGVDDLVDAAIEILGKRHDLRFVFAGSQSDDKAFYELLLRKIKATGLGDYFHFQGFVENVEQLFLNSTLHVCPSKKVEALSNVTIEAKMFGVPSVVYNTGGLPELISHTEDGYVCENNSVNELVTGILFFINNEEKAKRAGKNAIDSLSRLGITEANFTNQWLKIYHD